MRASVVTAAVLSMLYFGAAQAEERFTFKVLYHSGGSGNGGEGNGGEEPPVEEVTPPDNPTGWLDYFKSKGLLTGLNDLSEWGSSWEYAYLVGPTINENDLPKGAFGVPSIRGLNVQDAKFTHVNFLRGVKEVTGNLYLNSTASSWNINGVGDLTSAYDLIVDPTGLTNLNGLSNLQRVNTFSIKRPNLQPMNMDTTSLSNIGGVQVANGKVTIKLDYDPYRDSRGPSWDSPICQLMKPKNKMDIWLYYNRISNGSATYEKNPYYGAFCKSDDEWLEFIHKKNKTMWRYGYTGDFPAVGGNVSFWLNDAGLKNSDLPKKPLPAVYSQFEVFDFKGNDLTDLNFLRNIDHINELYTYKNYNLEDISVLQKFTSINYLELSDNKIKNVDALRNLTRANIIDLSYNESLNDISGLSNLTRVKDPLYGNPGAVYIDDKPFSKVPSYDSPFCQNWMAGNIVVVDYDTSRVRSPGEICKP
ncbi:Internalin-A precursor [compost metagenome]